MFTAFSFRHKLSFAANISLLWILAVSNESWALEVSTAPVATLYSGVNCSGRSILTRKTMGELKTFNDQARSVMATGVWIFFEHVRFNAGQETGLVEYIFHRHNECVNIRNVARKISSLRLVGNRTNFADDYLDLYEGKFFQGVVQDMKKDVQNVKKINKVSSLIITGRRPWTVYSKADFKGSSVCVKPPKSTNWTPAFVQTIKNISNYKGSSIKSVKLGCRGEVKVHQVEAIQANTQVGFTLHDFNN